MQLDENEYPAYFGRYISLADSSKSLVDELKHSFSADIDFLQSIGEEKKDHSYGEGKWTIGEVMQHLIDVELVMAHRAFRISRKDETPLPGFDHNNYAVVADVSQKPLANLCEELKTVRDVTNLHFAHLNDEEMKRMGTASNNPISVRALGYIIVGHIKHHINILKEHYL